MLVLTILGFWHLGRVSPAEEFMAPVLDSQRTRMPA
jgi:hypothetical protein